MLHKKNGTNQIIWICQEFGLYDKSYHSIIGNTIINEDNKILKCKYKNYIEIQENGLPYYKSLGGKWECLDLFKYFALKTEKCLNKCPNNKQKASIITGNKEAYY